MTPLVPSNPVLEAIYRRRATRAFTDDAVSSAQLRELLQAAVHAPTSRHTEPWAFVIVQDRALLRHISDRAKQLAVSVDGAEHPWLAPAGPLADPAFDVFHGAGALVAIGTKWPGHFAIADCWLAAENLMLAATSLGLATCPIGLAIPAFEDEAIRRELGLPKPLVVVVPIVVGRAAAESAAQSRREPEIVCWK